LWQKLHQLTKLQHTISSRSYKFRQTASHIQDELHGGTVCSGLLEQLGSAWLLICNAMLMAFAPNKSNDLAFTHTSALQTIYSHMQYAANKALSHDVHISYAWPGTSWQRNLHCIIHKK
jgi:hypothetical protein